MSPLAVDLENASIACQGYSGNLSFSVLYGPGLSVIAHSWAYTYWRSTNVWAPDIIIVYGEKHYRRETGNGKRETGNQREREREPRLKALNG